MVVYTTNKTLLMHFHQNIGLVVYVTEDKEGKLERAIELWRESERIRESHLVNIYQFNKLIHLNPVNLNKFSEIW